MKTAISMPDETYERATRQASELGMNRSEFFARAAERYIEELETASLTDRIDEALNVLGEADDSTTDTVVAGHRLLEAMDDEW